MKKIEKNRKRNIILTKKREKRRVEKVRNKKWEKSNKAYIDNPYGRSKPREIRKAKKERLRFLAPNTISLDREENYKKTVGLVYQIRNAVIFANTKVKIDFSQTENLTATGTLYLLAEIDRLQRAKKSKDVVRANMPASNKVAQAFQQVGLSRKLGIKGWLKITREDVDFWNYLTGVANPGGNDEEETFWEKLEGSIDKNITKSLFGGFTEAITNSINHAYIEDRGDGIQFDERRWWAFAGVRDETFFLIVCDLGIGIPRSFPKNWSKRIIENLFERFNLADTDADYIKAALNAHTTRTKEKHRGRGMKNILEATVNFEQGEIIIISNKGTYKWDIENDEDQYAQRGTSIMGTVVGWKIPIEDKRDG